MCSTVKNVSKSETTKTLPPVWRHLVHNRWKCLSSLCSKFFSSSKLSSNFSLFVASRTFLTVEYQANLRFSLLLRSHAHYLPPLPSTHFDFVQGVVVGCKWLYLVVLQKSKLSLGGSLQRITLSCKLFQNFGTYALHSRMQSTMPKTCPFEFIVIGWKTRAAFSSESARYVHCYEMMAHIFSCWRLWWPTNLDKSVGCKLIFLRPYCGFFTLLSLFLSISFFSFFLSFFFSKYQFLDSIELIEAASVGDPHK